MKNKGHKVGLRTVAVVEAAKGAAVLTLCILLLSLLHKDLYNVADRLTDVLRLSPDSRLADWFYELADRTTGRGIWMAISVGCVYATGRFLEAYGLWNQRRWGEWLSVVTGAIYLPFELYAVVRHPHWANVLLLAGNILVVLYIISILAEARRCREANGRCEEAAELSAADDPPAKVSSRIDSSGSHSGAADVGSRESRSSK